MALLLAVSGCAGYQVGADTLYPPGVRTVHVPMFESDSFRRDLGERITEAVVKRIEDKAGLKVVDNAKADSVLTGRLVADRKSVLSRTWLDEPRDIEESLRVQISWVDRRGSLLGGPMAMTVPAVLVDLTGEAHYVIVGGQSITTAQQQAIDRLADQIVGQMEAPW